MLLSPRLIKHTGYGNAAGLLARRGLMAGGRLVSCELLLKSWSQVNLKVNLKIIEEENLS